MTSLPQMRQLLGVFLKILGENILPLLPQLTNLILPGPEICANTSRGKAGPICNLAL